LRKHSPIHKEAANFTRNVRIHGKNRTLRPI